MIVDRRARLLAGVATLGMLVATVPAIGQNEAPESLLPPGFDQPVSSPTPSPSPRPSSPAPSNPVQGQRPIQDRPVSSTPGTPPSVQPLPDETTQTQIGTDAGGDGEEQDALEESLDSRLASAQSLPPGAQRSLMLIGVLTPADGGMAAQSLGRAGGAYTAALLRATRGALVSRWGTILLRRTLLSRLQTPSGVNGADWAAERASLLTRLGDPDGGRMLVQSVDGPDFSARLMSVALNSYMATADPAGLCPVLPFDPVTREGSEWLLARAICSGLAGQQSAAAEQIDRAARGNDGDPIDRLLAEKVVGAGVNGRRAVTIEWDDVEELTPWRFGLGLATGVEPPDRLFRTGGRVFQAWRARAPMLSFASRIAGADVAAAMGVLAHDQMIDLYAAAYDDPGAGGDLRARAALVRAAYVQQAPADRLAAMQSLWDRSDNAFVRQSAHVLTAEAAARFPVSADYADASDDLIASMLAGGFDRSAARWASIVEKGGRSWAMIALSAPGADGPVAGDVIDAFVDDDSSQDMRASRFLVAGLAGLGRISGEDRRSFEERLGMNLDRKTRWTAAIDAATRRKEPATVAILAAVGMQGLDWSSMTPLHLYHIVASLKAVGLEAEARMIAAEAIART